ncbi:hypothetical protein GCM10009119_23890 [Algoriphagus jejuensis]|uniref:Sulfatase N-terminal domain-containing protein n=1 Tax=Algoriphagus jejuensis TaxID=419934 RepID=A0ABP3YDE7_9BACT
MKNPLVSLTIFLLFFATLLVSQVQQSSLDRPNFIIIFTDDQGYGYLGTFGHPTIKTPNIDRRAAERQRRQESLTQSGKKLIPISLMQKLNFAGNMLEVTNDGGERFAVMSQAALYSLGLGQIQQIGKHSTIISTSISTIEKSGGGSA